MNFAKKLLFVFMFFLFPIITFAMFCPNNFNLVNAGDTLQQVTQQCGKPDSQKSVTTQPEGPQEWSYYIPQAVSSNYMSPTQGTLKTQITFDSNDKAINISVNGIGVGSSTICGTMIQLGDSREAVKAACGDPSFINKQNGGSTELGATPPPIKVTTFTYGSKNLIFENGKLTDK